MKCPYCAHKFLLTWRRYFESMTGEHKCPACGRVSLLRYPSPSAAFQGRIAIGLPAFATTIAIALVLPEERGLKIGYMVSFFAFLPVDRWLAARLRSLKKR